MPAIDVVIMDATASKEHEASVPQDVASVRLVAKLIELMNLPLTGPDGQPLSYKLHHKASGRQLRDGESLSESGVASGDTLRLVPEITAG